VYEKDKFEVKYGLSEDILHIPFEGDAGELRAVYAVAELKDGGIQYEVMYRHEIDAIRKRSKASGSGPWVSDYPEMARKTVIRRLSKYLPMSVDLARAVEAEDAQETGELSAIDIEMGQLPELTESGEIQEPRDPALAKGDSILSKIQ
jgi:recombination protein RecT